MNDELEGNKPRKSFCKEGSGCKYFNAMKTQKLTYMLNVEKDTLENVDMTREVSAIEANLVEEK